MKLTNSTLFFALFLLFAPGTNAQEKMIARDGFEEGYRAIQFGIGDNFRLNNFDGASINLMKFTSEKKARFLRASVFTRFTSLEEDRDDESTTTDLGNLTSDTTFSSSSAKKDTFETELRAHLGTVSYIKTNSDVLPFISRSIFLGTRIYSGTNENPSEIDNGQGRERNLESSDLRFEPTIGLNIGFGADYFISKNISLNAQFGASLSYAFDFFDYSNTSDEIIVNNETRVQNSDRSSTSHELILRTTGVLFGLTAYF